MRRIVYLAVLLGSCLDLFSSSIVEQSKLTKTIFNKYCKDCLTYTFKCTDDPLCQIYHTQNMCTLIQEIPKELKNLQFAVYPNALSYGTDRFLYNKRFNIFPHAIFQPRNEQEVAYVLKWLKEYGLEFVMRSGGHCYEPGSVSPGYVIDLRNFLSVRINLDKEEVYVGSGCHLGGVIKMLANHGYALPTGTCGSNGIGGFTLGGGLGYLTRKFGVTCDVVKSIRVLTADLQVRTVDAEHDPDLFWALLGAGAGSYGIVLGFTFKIFYLPKVSFVQLDWEWDPAQVLEVTNAWQSWIESLSNDITTEITFRYVNGKRTLTVSALKAGDEPFTEWEFVFEKFKPRVTVNALMPFIRAAEILGTDFSPVLFAKAKSKMLFERMPYAGINTIIDFYQDLFEQSKKLVFKLSFGSMGGQAREGNTSFFPHQAFAWFFQFVNWGNQDQAAEAIAELTRFYLAVEPYTSPYSYGNFIDYDLGDTYLNAYYGSNVERLVQVKNSYDPGNLFKWRQSIPLAV